MLFALVAWFAIIACLAALCTVASRGDEAAAADREEHGVISIPRRAQPLRLAHSARPLRGSALRLR